MTYHDLFTSHLRFGSAAETSSKKNLYLGKERHLHNRGRLLPGTPRTPLHRKWDPLINITSI